MSKSLIKGKCRGFSMAAYTRQPVSEDEAIKIMARTPDSEKYRLAAQIVGLYRQIEEMDRRIDDLCAVIDLNRDQEAIDAIQGG